MRNSTGAVIYYLFFASPNKTGEKIIKDLRNTGKRGQDNGDQIRHRMD